MTIISRLNSSELRCPVHGHNLIETTFVFAEVCLCWLIFSRWRSVMIHAAACSAATNPLQLLTYPAQRLTRLRGEICMVVFWIGTGITRLMAALPNKPKESASRTVTYQLTSVSSRML